MINNINMLYNFTLSFVLWALPVLNIAILHSPCIQPSIEVSWQLSEQAFFKIRIGPCHCCGAPTQWYFIIKWYHPTIYVFMFLSSVSPSLFFRLIWIAIIHMLSVRWCHHGIFRIFRLFKRSKTLEMILTSHFFISWQNHFRPDSVSLLVDVYVSLTGRSDLIEISVLTSL